ncbi:hypothetical protein SELMODRAFT_270732 [Selaginella moellendorffii]|uniref:Large ribosomal subunit protein bL9c n=1 Tax=Selaginella moellendorffii TaxID=88036 RepID=D8RC52_SELML|nr:hypothetical protein SELMODRAFT_160530 [Selaginella moellendorffii]EFJ29794.1 hypothetical protein SELMODRAFT_270732 [Selaginella moellendorffii]
MAAALPVFEGLRCATTSSSARLDGVSLGISQPRRLRVMANKRSVKTRQIILSEDVEFLGKTGDLVSVRAGYFRNFLFPKGKAKMATPEYLKELKLEAERKENEKRKLREDAEALARELQRLGPLSVKRKRGMARLIFGTVTTQDLADIIEYRTKKKIDKRNMTVPEIREIGTYTAEVKLHPEVTTQVKITVVGS